MKIIFLILFSLSVHISWSQKYAIAFNGHIDTALIHSMEFDCKQFQHVFKVKINYKPEQEKGEFIIQLVEDENRSEGEENSEFSIAEIKAYLISKKLNPVSFITLEK